MTETQEYKMQLLEKFGISNEPKSIEFCREAYKFLAEGETNPAPANTVANSLDDGIYYVLADGSVIRHIPDIGVFGILDGTLVRYVGIKWGSLGLKVALHDSADGEEITLTSGKDTTKYDGYKDNYLDAVADWNGKANTEHLKAIGLNEETFLANGEYIPSLGEMYLIYLNRRALNQALEMIGCDPIKDDWYWTSTESSTTSAFLINQTYGNATGFNKAKSKGYVRPVSDFNSYLNIEQFYTI